MFENPGSKIKVFAKIMFWLTLVGAGVSGFALFMENDDLFLISLCIWAGGLVVAYLTGLFLTGFGELIEKTAECAANTQAMVNRPAAPMMNGSMPMQPVQPQIPSSELPNL